MPRYYVVLVTLIVFLLTACSGNNSTPAPAAPVFTSMPGTQATEGFSPYSYQLAASGAAVTFSLSNAPTGATLSENTLSWTPTAQQSRTANSFTVIATASGAASATQSWTVRPSGTIHTQTTSVPTSTVKPLISAVQNPKINGADLFNAATINGTVTLSWDPSAIGTPFGYSVAIMSPTASPNGTVEYVSTTTLSTAKTSITVSPNLLRSGQTLRRSLTWDRGTRDGPTQNLQCGHGCEGLLL